MDINPKHASFAILMVFAILGLYGFYITEGSVNAMAGVTAVYVSPSSKIVACPPVIKSSVVLGPGCSWEPKYDTYKRCVISYTMKCPVPLPTPTPTPPVTCPPVQLCPPATTCPPVQICPPVTTCPPATTCPSVQICPVPQLILKPTPQYVPTFYYDTNQQGWTGGFEGNQRDRNVLYEGAILLKKETGISVDDLSTRYGGSLSNAAGASDFGTRFIIPTGLKSIKFQARTLKPGTMKFNSAMTLELMQSPSAESATQIKTYEVINTWQTYSFDNILDFRNGGSTLKTLQELQGTHATLEFNFADDTAKVTYTAASNSENGIMIDDICFEKIDGTCFKQTELALN